MLPAQLYKLMLNVTQKWQRRRRQREARDGKSENVMVGEMKQLSEPISGTISFVLWGT